MDEIKVENPIVKRVLRMVPRAGMREVFYEELSEYETQRECFRELNKQYENLIGEPRFKNYESFRISCLTRDL